MGKWTESLIESELLTVVERMGSFPSHHELINMGRGDLANAITKDGGIIAWAAKLGLDRKQSASDFGWEGEDSVIKILADKGYVVSPRDRVGSPFDILVNGIIRIDVKTAKYTEYGPVKGWFYRIGKTCQSDLVILYQADTGKCYVLPWIECTKSNMTISKRGGKYARYFESWSILDRHLEALKFLKPE